MTLRPVQEVMQLAQERSNLGDFAQAQDIYRQILAQMPHYPDALYSLGMLKTRFNENEEAIELLSQAAAANPGDAKYHDSLGTAYQKTRRYAQAIPCFRRAIELRPELMEARLHLSAAQMELMDLSAPQRRISYLIASRNDHFCGNPMDRLALVLRRVLDVAKDFEVVVADWGSDVPIYEAMKRQVPAKGKIRFLHISKSVTDGIQSSFSEVHALNAAVRRCRGTFAARIDQDTLIGDVFNAWATHVLQDDDRRVYFSMRRDLKPGVTRIDPNAPVWQGCPADWSHYLIGAVGILLAPRRLWHWMRGYDERLIFRNHMEHDLCVRFANLTGLRNLGVIVDCDFYHLWHEEVTGKTVNEQKTLNRLVADALTNLRANDENWGLGALDAQITENVL
jgi:hypothetical protein